MNKADAGGFPESGHIARIADSKPKTSRWVGPVAAIGGVAAWVVVKVFVPEQMGWALAAVAILIVGVLGYELIWKRRQ